MIKDRYRMGDLVQTHNRGFPLYGVVIFSGPQRLGVAWQTGRKVSLQRNRWWDVEPVSNADRDAALEATKTQRAVLLTARRLAS